jgi:hypothetical protein
VPRSARALAEIGALGAGRRPHEESEHREGHEELQEGDRALTLRFGGAAHGIPSALEAARRHDGRDRARGYAAKRQRGQQAQSMKGVD